MDSRSTDERALDVLARVTGLTRSLLRPHPGGIEATLRASTVLKAMKAFAAFLLPADDRAPARIWREASDGEGEPVEYVRADLVANLVERGRRLGITQAAAIADPPLAHRAGPVGLWRQRRAQMAADIRRLSTEGGAPADPDGLPPPPIDESRA